MEMHEGMQESLTQVNMWIENEGLNRVKCLDGEIRMENIRNHNKGK